MRFIAAAVCSISVAVVAVTAGPASAGVSAQSRAAAVPGVASFTGRTADGSNYLIEKPSNWNGTLLLFSHGYRSLADWSGGKTSMAAENAPGDSPVQASAAPTLPSTHDALLAQGYALAGSSYPKQGWAVAEAVKANELLLRTFTSRVGTAATRLYVWGDSLGGLVSAVFAEKHPDLVDGVAPMCGVVAGPNDNLDLALDLAVAVKTLIYPKLKLTGFTSWADAAANYAGAQNAIMAGLTSKSSSVQAGMISRLLAVRMISDGPKSTLSSDGGSSALPVLENLPRGAQAAAESALSGLFYATYGRYDVERRVGGNPSGNVGVSYLQRVSTGATSPADYTADEKEFSEVFPFSVGLLRSYARTVDTWGARISAAPAARAAFAATGTPSGQLQDPTITLHDQYDPLVIVQNERQLADRAATAGAAGKLLQLTVTPVQTSWLYDKSKPASTTNTPAAFGAGHCVFFSNQRLAVVQLLDRWVTTGTRPDAATITAVLTTLSAPGTSPAYQPPAWPAR